MKKIKINYFLCFLFIVCLLFSCSTKTDKSSSTAIIINDVNNNKTTITDTTSISVNYNKKYSYRVFYTNTEAAGFGYEILVDNKLYIRQNSIPAINGFKAFKSKEDAIKVAELAVKKMAENDGLPTIDIKDLDSLKIVY